MSYLCSEHPCTNRDKNDDVKDSFYEELEHLFDTRMDVILVHYCNSKITVKL